jgi:hypothetical protein
MGLWSFKSIVNFMSNWVRSIEITIPSPMLIQWGKILNPSSISCQRLGPFEMTILRPC